MADYKAMYFHLAGQMSIAIEALEGLVAITDKLKKAQQATEEMFMDAADEDDLDEKPRYNDAGQEELPAVCSAEFPTGCTEADGDKDKDKK